MYICDENVLANELDFKKALDLLNYLEDFEERESQRLRIWAKAILRDAWTQFDTDNVLQSINGTIFFKIIEYALGTGTFLFEKSFFRFCMNDFSLIYYRFSQSSFYFSILQEKTLPIYYQGQKKSYKSLSCQNWLAMTYFSFY